MKVTVAVFPHTSKTGYRTYHAYTLWYNPAWSGCCMHEVDVEKRGNAKRLAVEEHKQKCVQGVVGADRRQGCAEG